MKRADSSTNLSDVVDGLRKALKWVTLFFVLVIGASIVGPYGHYIPPDFDAGFLFGRADYFYSIYAIGFYLHIVSAPIVLVIGLAQSSQSLRRRYRKLHRQLGSLYVYLVLFAMLPGGLVLARYAYGGIVSTVGFVLLCAVTAATTFAGWRSAKSGRFTEHGIHMQRSFLLVCSAILLRVLLVQAKQFGFDPIASYVWIVWLSWLPPLMLFETLRLARKSFLRAKC